ncbi:MAG: hypothetical protein QNL62_25265 [Gammaproteobacteria bacterium]|nr:hypothetical protein [Gammaproteobacteria bacterium]
MSWLTIPAANNTKLPIDMDGSAGLIKVLGGLKDSIGELSTRSAVDILDGLLTKPVNPNDPIALAITNLSDRPIDDILQDWKKLQEKYNGAHGPKLRALARNFKELKGDFSSLPKLIDWKLINTDFNNHQVLNQKVQFGLKAAAAASISIEACAKLPVMPTDTMLAPADKAVCRIGMDGKLEIDGELGFSAGFVTAGVASSAAGQTELDLYFLEEPDTHFGMAAAQNIKDLVSVASPTPIDAAVLSDLMHTKGMHCMSISAQSTLIFSAKIGFAKTFNAGEKVFVKAGVDAGITITEKGLFEFLFVAENSNGERAIAVQIKRKSGSENVSKNSVGIEVDPRDYFKSIQPMIEEHLGIIEDTLEDFQDFLPGSDFLNDELSKLIDDHINDSALNELAISLVGIDSSSSPQEVLRDRIIGVVETSVASWSEDISVAVPGVVSDIQSGLMRLSPDIPDFKDKLESLVKDTLDKKQELLKNKVTTVITSSAQFEKISSKLGNAGATVSQNVSNLQEQIDVVTSAVTGLLDRVQGKINKLRNALQTATEKTVSLKISSERKESKEESLELLFNIYPERDHDAAQKAFNAILLGDMNKVFSLINGFRENDNPAIVGINGGYSIYKSLTETNTSDLVLWNIKLGTKSIFDADVRLSVNLDGSIVVQSSAEYARIQEGIRQKRILSFVETTEMLFSKHSKTFNIGISLSHEDEELDIDDVSSFFNGLIKRNLISRHVVDKAIEKLSGSGGRNAVKGKLDVGLTLTTSQLTTMLDSVEAMFTKELCDSNDLRCKVPSISCPDGAGRKGCHWVLDTVSKITADVVEEQHTDQNFIEILNDALEVMELGDIAKGIRIMQPGMARKYSEEGYRYYEEKFHYYTDEFDMLGDLSFLEYRRYGAMALYEILAHIKGLSEVGANINTTNSQLQAISGFTVSELRAHQYRIARILPVWWAWGHEWKNWAFFTKEMRSLNVAFFESWINLARGENQEGEAPKLWASITIDEDDIQKTTLLT